MLIPPPCKTKSPSCLQLTGERHMLNLMEAWGYAPLLPSQLPAFPPLHAALHILIGLIILAAGRLSDKKNGNDEKNVLIGIFSSDEYHICITYI